MIASLCLLVIFITDVKTLSPVVSVRQVSGLLRGTSILKCCFMPRNIPVSYFEWRSGKYGNILYYESLAEGSQFSGPKGNYRERNITGIYEQSKHCHILFIAHSLLQDEGWYTCVLVTASGKHGTGSIFLSLVAPPDVEPEIQTESGEVWARASKVCAARKVAAGENLYLTCKAGKSIPAANIAWSISNGTDVEIMETQFTTTMVANLNYTAVSRKINISTASFSLVICNCTVQVPDPNSTRMDDITICLRILNDDDRLVNMGSYELNKGWIAFESICVLLITAGWIWIYRIGRVSMLDKIGWLQLNISCSAIALMFLIAAAGFMHVLYDNYYVTTLQNHGVSVDGSLKMIFPVAYPITVCSVLVIRFVVNIVAAVCLYHKQDAIKNSIIAEENSKNIDNWSVAISIFFGPGACALWRYWSHTQSQKSESTEDDVLVTWSFWVMVVVHNVMVLISFVVLVLLAVTSQECFDFPHTGGSCRISSPGYTVALYLFYGFLLLFYFIYLCIIYLYREMSVRFLQKLNDKMQRDEVEVLVRGNK